MPRGVLFFVAILSACGILSLGTVWRNAHEITGIEP